MRRELIALVVLGGVFAVAGCNPGEVKADKAQESYHAQEEKARQLAESGALPSFEDGD